jgi:hypothetical protein
MLVPAIPPPTMTVSADSRDLFVRLDLKRKIYIKSASAKERIMNWMASYS